MHRYLANARVAFLINTPLKHRLWLRRYKIYGFWSCIILVIPFLIIGVLFAIFKEKAAKFVSGFNEFSKEEQALYDKAHISRDIRNQCFMWAIIMLAGALLSCFLTPYIAIPTYIIWVVLFFREVHFDNHKAFEKYLLK